MTDLLQTKDQERVALITYLNGLTIRLLETYPQAEVESWTVQKVEAEAILAAGDDATLAMAPFLTKVCLYHHGASDDVSRLAQVKIKAEAVHANAESWAEAAAFVNGLRARTEEAMALATTIEEVSDIMSSMRLEVEQFRQVAGI